MSIKMRRMVEREIAETTINALLQANFLISVNDGEEMVLEGSRNAPAILNAMFTTDEDWLIVIRRQDNTDIQHGWVRFIYGNDGRDVINDYTVNLEQYLGAGTVVDEKIKEYAD